MSDQKRPIKSATINEEGTIAPVEKKTSKKTTGKFLQQVNWFFIKNINIISYIKSILADALFI